MSMVMTGYINPAPREDRVRTLFAKLNAQDVKGLSLLDVERERLLTRLAVLRTEIENAPIYAGALL